MDPERDDYADLDPIRPRMLWYGSVWFLAAAAVLAGATLAACAFAYGDRAPTETWVLGSLAVVGPYVLVIAAARRAGAGGRGRGVIRACGPVVLGAGSLMLAAAIRDAHQRAHQGRPEWIPATAIVGGPLLFTALAAGTLAVLVARPGRSTR